MSVFFQLCRLAGKGPFPTCEFIPGRLWTLDLGLWTKAAPQIFLTRINDFPCGAQAGGDGAVDCALVALSVGRFTGKEECIGYRCG